MLLKGASSAHAHEKRREKGERLRAHPVIFFGWQATQFDGVHVGF